MPDQPNQDATPTRRIGLGMGLLAWFALAGVLILAFQEQLADLVNPNRQIESVHTSEAIEITLQPSRGGHYLLDGTINGQRVTFMLDTGATQVAIPAAIADDLGLQRGNPVQVRTANGIVTAHQTELATVGLGDIELEGVAAQILPGYDSDAILLGMSALDRLDWRREGQELTLRFRR